MKKALLAVLAISLLLEAALTVLCFAFPVKAFELFGLQYDEAYAFLGYIIAWFLLLVTVLIGYIMWSIIQDRNQSVLLYLLGFWWIFLGIGVYFKYGIADNLMLDSSKGLIIVVLNYFMNRAEKRKMED